MTLGTMKEYFLELIFPQIFSFSKMKKFLYFCKTLIEVEKDFLKKFTSNVPPLLILK